VTYALIPLALAVVCVWLGHRMLTAILLMGYLSIEGFLKLLSNYNRIVHVGMDILVLSLAGWLTLGAMLRRRRGIPDLPWTWLILLYALWIVLQVFNPHSAGLVVSLASFKVHLTMIPLYFIVAGLFREPKDVSRFLAALAAIGLAPYGMALVQYALGPSSVLDLSPRFWQNISYFHEWRPFGTSATPGGSAVFAMLITPLAMVLLMTPGPTRSSRLVALLSIALAIGTFVVSGGRQVFLACVLAVLLMVALLATRGRGRGVLVLVLVMAVGLGSYVGVENFLRPMATEAVARDPRAPDIWRERDVTARLLTLTEAGTFAESRANPINGILYRARHYPFGAGLGRTGSAAGAFQAQINATRESAQINSEVGWSDNFFSDVIVEAGVPGAIMLTTILIGMIVGAMRLARRAVDPVVGAASAAVAGVFVSILAMSWGSQPLLSNPITAFFWVLAGMVAGMRHMEAEMAAEQVEAAEAAEAVPALAR
jgi:hypothetical protein